jgi:DNA invertase Pin-like site-specific DNA recombinase
MAADTTFANKLNAHILAAVAGYGREAISECTKAALAAAKARGTAGAVMRMRAARRAQAAQFAANVLPIIREVQATGHTSCNAIARQLNARKVATAVFPFSARWRLSRDCCSASHWNWWPARRMSRSPS